MAKGKRKAKLEDLPGQDDPRAALDGAVLLAASQAVVKVLREDLGARAKASPAVTEALKVRHAVEKAAKTTADSFAEWHGRFIEQVAAAWLLSCVFVRTLEDRGLLRRSRIAGQGAADGQRQFFEMSPSLTERDYLLMVFRELSQFAAAKDLFDAKHNPVWLLSPSAEAAKALLNVFRMPSVDAPSLRFGQEDTRFVGDLYQDLDEGVRDRFALLQTPRFVEAFILDRTLEPAIEKFGLDDTTVIDPACGSGHFLLGSFERLFDHRLRTEPGLDRRAAATRALDAVFGADINPYAVAISRFRLTLTFFEKAGFGKIADAPALPLHLVVADSLLHNPSAAQLEFGDREGMSKAAWEGQEFALEDEAAARDVLHRAYAAVVGNPPYITVKDSVLRERYRTLYPKTCHREYSLAVPFTERFFQLARARGRVGMITANSFMKREFGTKLIEEYLPTVNLDLVVNTSGAYIPGHGTPTVLLFGSAEPATGTHLHTVLAIRGEPTTPERPEDGRVWRSIADHWNEVGFENDFIGVAQLDRPWLESHPWILAGGGAIELTKTLRARAAGMLGDLANAIGFSTITGEDNVLMGPEAAYLRNGVAEAHIRRNVIGEEVRDWALGDGDACLWPNTPTGGRLTESEIPDVLRYLWPYRSVLRTRRAFGVPVEAKGIPWWALREVYSDRMKTSLTITFAFVATHNHFVLDRGGKVFNRTAPIIKLPDTATEDDHLAVLAYLNSSTACFWMKQVFFDKGALVDDGKKWQAEPARVAYEFAGTQLGKAPSPPVRDREASVHLARRAADLAFEREALLTDVLLGDDAPATGSDLAHTLDRLAVRDEALLGHLVAIQEELDWRTYFAWGLCTDAELLDASFASVECGIPVGLRPFEVLAARRGQETGIDGQALSAELPGSWPSRVRALWDRRIAELRTNRELRLLEQPLYKRRWLITPKDMGGRTRTFADRVRDVIRLGLATRLEAHISSAGHLLRRCDVVALVVSDSVCAPFAERLAGGVDLAIDTIFGEESIPFLAWLRFKTSGEKKRSQWETTWQLQRDADAGAAASEIPVPPKYGSGDYASTSYWELRGKLDVPKERFISYPHCESDEDHEPLYGWGGWDHAQRAKALATLYWNRKTEEGWSADRLTPMLAGILELLPWLHQWHRQTSDEFGGESPAGYYDGFLNGQCAELGLSHDDLRSWRPPERRRATTPKRKVVLNA